MTADVAGALRGALAAAEAREGRRLARERRRAREAAERLSLALLSDDERALYVEHSEQEAREAWARAAERGKGSHSGWRHGTPQCDGCRRILPGYNHQCPDCGGWSRPRDGAR